MGNRATIVFESQDGKTISSAVYLHWNGGPESVYAFLAELDRREVRADQCYEVARFAQLVGEFFDGGSRQGGLSLGIMDAPCEITPKSLDQFDHCDNGSYIVCRSVKPMRVRRFTSGGSLDALPVEWSPEQVSVETKRARQDKAFRAIREAFQRVTGDRLTEGEHLKRKVG